MADNVTIPATGTGTATPVIATDDVGGVQYQRVKLDVGGDGVSSPVTSLAQESGGNLDAIKSAVEVIDDFISGSRGLVTEDNSAAIKTAVETIDNFISGARGLVTEDNSGAIKTAVETIDNFISGARGLVTEDNSAAIKTSVELIDDTVYTDDTSTHATGTSKGLLVMAAATPTDGSVNANDIGAVAMTTDRKLHVSVQDALPAGTNAIGTLAANSGVDIGDVTVNNAAGSSAVNIQDGGNSITVDYATTGSGTATGALRVELPTNGTGVVGLNAGTQIVGKVGIDQTTPGTTNAVKATNFPTTADTNAGNNSASTIRVAVATDDINLAAINAVSGTTSGAAVVTDATGTIQQYLRGLIKGLAAGTWTVLLGATTNLIGYVGFKSTYGSATTLTTTNWSNLASGSGWQSDGITTSGAKDVLIYFQTKGAAGSTALADFYLAENSASGTYSDNATGTEGTFTAANRKNARYLGSIQLNTTNSVYGWLRASDIFATMPEKIAIIGINNSGGTISSTGGDTVFKYQLVN